MVLTIEQDGGHSYPQVKPPTDEFGYGIDEEIYDIADEELPHLQPPQSMPHPPQSVPHPPQGISRPPMRPPMPPEDPEDDEIYDCMDDIELIEEGIFSLVRYLNLVNIYIQSPSLCLSPLLEWE